VCHNRSAKCRLDCCLLADNITAKQPNDKHANVSNTSRGHKSFYATRKNVIAHNNGCCQLITAGKWPSLMPRSPSCCLFPAICLRWYNRLINLRVQSSVTDCRPAWNKCQLNYCPECISSFKAPFTATQLKLLNSTRRPVELSCVGINGT